MQKKRDIPPVHQLELELSVSTAARQDTESKLVNNVVHVQFGATKTQSSHAESEDQALVKLLLQNAQRLKW